MSSPGTPPQVAVIGCGHWGTNLVRNFAQLGALAAIADSTPAIAEEQARRHGVPVRDSAAILADPAIVGIVVATPAATHFDQVRQALEAGKHVFCEKPLALHQAQARQLCDLARRQGRLLMVGHLLRHHPAFVTLAGICAAGRLGKLRYIQSHRLNLGKVRSEENILWSFAPHDISMILALAGAMPDQVLAIGHNFLNKSIADVTTTHLSFASGLAAHIHVSWLHPFKEQKLVVVGETGMAVFDDSRDWAEKITLYSHRIHWKAGEPVPERAKGEAVPLDPAEPLKLECAHFLDCISHDRQPVTDGAEALRVLQVLEAAQHSLESNRPVPLAAAHGVDDPYIHPTAIVDAPTDIGSGTRIWHFSHILPHSRIGRDCVVGQNVSIGPHAVIGDRCKIQNNVSVYQGVTLEDGVFCGPSMVFTNVLNPRAEINRKAEFRPTLVKRGATIGANATIVCGHTIGCHAMVGAGAVVTRDVPDHALVVGNPARIIGHVCACGERLPADDWADCACPACGRRHRRRDGSVTAEEN